MEEQLSKWKVDLKKDFDQLRNFGGEHSEYKIKFSKVVYDRVKAFDTEEAYESGWPTYGIFCLIMGGLRKEIYSKHPAAKSKVEPLKPSKEFEQWLFEHREFGPSLIMLAVTYGKYELGEEQ